MVGLAASELEAETLFPGDTIEYFSVAFVAGDPRGHRVAKVLRVNQDTKDEFPIEVDTQEMLPMTIMLKRKRDRNGGAISSNDAKWRKLRTFRLVNGEVDGVTRADRLNCGLKKSLSDAMIATKKALAMEKQKKSQLGSKKLMNMYLASSNAKSNEREATSSQRRSLERSDRKRKTEFLSSQDSKELDMKVHRHSTFVSRKSLESDKLTWIHRHEDELARSKRKYGSDLPKSESRKRKHSNSMLDRHKKIDVAPKKTQKSISKYFDGRQLQNRPKHRIGLNLNKFVDHIEETGDTQTKAKKKRTHSDEHYALDRNEKKAHEVARKAHQDHSNMVRSVDFGKMSWSQQRKTYRKVNGGSDALRSWLKSVSKEERQGNVKEVRCGISMKTQRPIHQGPNSASGKFKVPMNRKNGISFIMPDNSSDTPKLSMAVNTVLHLH